MPKATTTKKVTKVMLESKPPRWSDVEIAMECIEAGIKKAFNKMNARPRPASPAFASQAVVYALGRHVIRSANKAEKCIEALGSRGNALCNTDSLYDDAMQYEKKNLRALEAKKSA